MTQQTASQWIAMEHYRMHSIEEWPESPRKASALAAVHSALAGLSRELTRTTECQVCLTRKRARTLVELPVELPLERAA